MLVAVRGRWQRIRGSGDGRPRRWRRRVFVGAGIAAALATVSSTSGAAALRREPSTPAGATPVLFIHGAATPAFGIDHLGPDCAPSPGLRPWAAVTAGNDGCEWDALRAYLDARSLDGQPVDAVTVGYFYNDTNMDAYIDQSGDSRRCFGRDFYGPARDGEHSAADGRPSHDSDADLRHLGYQLAWFIHDRYGAEPVRIVADSMGGVLVRAMLFGYAHGRYGRGENDSSCTYPTVLNIPRVVTLSSPHSGSTIATAACHVVPHPREFCQLVGNDPENDFLWTLDHSTLGLDPRTTGGTRWTLLGSVSDSIVAASSATDAGTGTRYTFRVVFYSASGGCRPNPSATCAYKHGYIKRDAAPGRDASVAWAGAGSGFSAHAPHPAAWIYDALSD